MHIIIVWCRWLVCCGCTQWPTCNDTRIHTYTMSSRGSHSPSSVSLRSGAQSPAGGGRPSVHNFRLNLASALNDPKMPRPVDLFTREWGESFVPSLPLPSPHLRGARLEDFQPYWQRFEEVCMLAPQLTRSLFLSSCEMSRHTRSSPRARMVAVLVRVLKFPSPVSHTTDSRPRRRSWHHSIGVFYMHFACASTNPCVGYC